MFSIAGDEVVIGVAVGVAAEAADGAGVGVGEDDAGVAVPVEAHPQAKFGADKTMDAAVVELELVLLGERELHEGAVELGKEVKRVTAVLGSRNALKIGVFLQSLSHGEDFGGFSAKTGRISGQVQISQDLSVLAKHLAEERLLAKAARGDFCKPFAQGRLCGQMQITQDLGVPTQCFARGGGFRQRQIDWVFLQTWDLWVFC